jgi:hypothetical protein
LKDSQNKRTSDQSGHSGEGAGIGAEIAKKAERIQGTSFSGRATTRVTGK